MTSILFIGSVLLTACKKESEPEKVRNLAPTISIITHENGDEVRDGFIESFEAIVADADHDVDDLEVVWYVDGEIVCDWYNANASGESTCDIVFQEGDEAVRAEVRDPRGADDLIELELNVLPTGAPDIEMLTPIADEKYYASELIHFSALIGDTEDAPEELIVVWTSDLDGELALDTTVNADGEISDYTYLTEGNHAIELRVEDSTGKVSTDDVVIQVGGPNNEPTCSFTEPLDGDTFLLGDLIVFSGSTVDIDIPNNQLLVDISSSLDGPVQSLSPFSDGTFSFATNTLSPGTHTMTLAATDDMGATCTTGMLISIGTAPTVSIDEPLDGDLFELAEIVTFRASVWDGEDQPSDIDVVWSSDLDGELYTGTANSQGIAQFSSSALSAGVHSISVSAIDSAGLFADDITTIRVNTLPVVDNIAFTPDPVYTNTSLSISATSSDSDGQNVSNSYAWYEDGVLTSFISTSIGSAELDVNEVWTVRVTPNDGYQDGPYTEASITVSNTDPVVNSVEISPNTFVYNDAVLTCTGTASDLDQSISPTFQWTVNGQTYSGATLSLSTLGVLPNYVIACNAIATDDWGASDMMTTSVTVGNRAPVLGPVTITPGSTGQIGDTLSCESIVTDPDGESLTATYDWSVNGFSAGAGNTFTLSSIVVNPSDVVTCAATVTDAYGESDLAVGSFTVVNEPPVINNISIVPVNPRTFDTVTCAAMVSDADGSVDPTVTYLFENATTGTTLYPNSSTNAEATLNLVDVSFNVGDELACHVTAMDNGGATVMETEIVTIVDSMPSIDSIAITPNSSVRVGTVLTCEATASDYEDGALIPSYEWTANGTVVSSIDTYVVDGAEANLGDTITCTTTAMDVSNQVVTDSVDVVVQNTAPVVSNVSILPSSAVTNDATLTCTPTIVDPNETVTGTFVWNRNGSQMAVSDTVDLSNFNVLPTDTIECVVSATDSQGANDGASATVIIGNRTPIVVIPTISNTSPELNETITCSASATDDDGEIPTVTYEWSDGQNTLGTGSSLTLTSSLVGVGDVIICTATATDNFGGTAGASNLATVVSSVTCGLTSCDINLDLGGGQSIDMVLIPAGSDPQGRYDLTNDVYLMTTEVTQGMFTALMPYDPTTYSTTYGVGNDYPAYYVDWHMAADFANIVTQRHNSVNGTSLQECYTCSGSGSTSVTCTEAMNPYQCSGYVLPTEAEWEYAARSGTQYDFWTSDGGGGYSSAICDGSARIQDGVTIPLLSDYAWYCGNMSEQGGGSKEVGQKLPNAFGLYDMHGNMFEWTADWWGCNFPQSVTDPYCDSAGSDRTRRGGDWGNSPVAMGTSFRYNDPPTYRYHGVGFRIGLHP